MIWTKKENYKPYEFIATDITSNCNLRCPFCANDFSNIKGNTLMTESTLDKVLTLLPLASPSSYLFSCAFEPTLHPEFVSYLEKIKEEHAPKVFFTTNLAKKISDDEIERLSRLKIAFINISLDSFVPKTFEEMRCGAKFSIFIDNLERFVSIFEMEPNAPRIRFTTVVLQSNVDEISDIVEKNFEQYHPFGHQVRFIYEGYHYSKEWKQKNLISNDDWAKLIEQCAKSSYSYNVTPPPAQYFPDDNAAYSKIAKKVIPPTPPFGLSISSDGTVFIYGQEKIKYNINEIDDPYTFFNNKRKSFQI